MSTLSPDIFRQYDIRGIYNQDLTDETAYLIGKGLGTFLQINQVDKIAVGRDNRLSGKIVCENFIKGLLETGCNVEDFGLVLNPFIYFSWHHLDFNAGAIVTASHNPPQYNGFKLSMKKRPLLGEDYQEILKICRNENFKRGTGELKENEIWTAYKQNILSTTHLNRKLRVAVDCGNGTASLFAPEILKDFGCEVFPIFCESDGSFPNHIPYPQKVEYYEKLKEEILENKLDAGISLDGDGDRVGIFDEKGEYIEADRLSMLFAADICQKNDNKKIVMNTSTSMAVIDYIKSKGGDFYLWKTGYPNITAKMNEIGAIFGGEISGHFFFKDKYFGFDDALYAAIRLLEILSFSKLPLSTVVSCFPRYFETREFRVEIPKDVQKLRLIDKIKNEIKEEYPDAEIVDFDGIRFSFSDGWGLIRPSNTEPLLTGRAEGKTSERFEQIKKIIKEKLANSKISLNWESVR